MLGMRLYVSSILRAAAEAQTSTPAVGDIRGSGDGRKLVTTVRQRKTITETAIGPEFDLSPSDRHRRIRFGSAVNDQLCVDVEPEALLAFHSTIRTRKARHRAAP